MVRCQFHSQYPELKSSTHRLWTHAKLWTTLPTSRDDLVGERVGRCSRGSMHNHRNALMTRFDCSTRNPRITLLAAHFVKPSRRSFRSINRAATTTRNRCSLSRNPHPLQQRSCSSVCIWVWTLSKSYSRCDDTGWTLRDQDGGLLRFFDATLRTSWPSC